MAQNEGGLTMIELSMAAVVILGAVITMMAMFDTAIDIYRYTTSRSLATQIANQALEDMRTLDYPQAVLAVPAGWPADPDLDTGFDPPKYKDINDSSATVWRSLLTTDTAAGLQVEGTVERQHITFIIHRYIMYVDDGATSNAFKRLVVKVEWPAASVPGEVILTTNFSKEDDGESRPLAKILGVRSTNYDYFRIETEDATMGIDDSIRGPGGGAAQPVIWTEAVVTGAKASYIDRVEYDLYDPSGTLVEETDITSTSPDFINGKHFLWDDLNTTLKDDGRGYLIRAEAFDDLGKSDVDALRINIDNEAPPAPATPEIIDTSGSAKMLTVTWDWGPDPTAVPEVARFIIKRKAKHDPISGSGTWEPMIDVASIPGTERSFINVGLSEDYRYEYQVIAVDTAGNTNESGESLQSNRMPVPTDLTRPNLITSATVEAVSWKTIELTWNQATDNAGGSGVGGYEWWATDDISSPWEWSIIAMTTDTVSDPAFYYDPNLKPGRTYYYAVRTFDNEGNLSNDWFDPPYTTIFATTPMR